MRSTVPLPDHPVLSSTAYQSWSNLNGIQILYLDGPDIEAVTVAAEQIGMDWARRQQESGSYYRPFFQFRFDATDSTSNSMASAVAATSYKMHGQMMTCSTLGCVLVPEMIGTTPHVFHGIDECNIRSRKKFWARLGEVTSKYEGPVKIVVTANNSEIYTSETFRNELKGWPGMALLVYEASHVVEVEVESENDMQNALIAHLCPIQLGEERIRRTLKRLESMDRKTMASVLHVAETYSRWPIQKSHDNFSLFLEIFENMTPSSTPREVVWGILRSIREQEWLASTIDRDGAREHSVIPNKGQGGSMTPPDDHDVQQCLADIRSRIRGLESLNRGKLCIRPDVLKLMTDEAEECWVRIKNQAPRRTAEFLLEYLKLPSSQERLKVLHENYQKRVQRSGNSITPPMTPDGRKSSLCKQMKDLSGPYVQWAKAYWAMSNPFSRPPKGPLRSAWSTWETSDEFELPKLETEHRIDGPVESLIQAVRDNDEAAALISANKIVSDFSSGNESTEDVLKFSSSVLWRATWLGMDRLLYFMLRQGRQQDDSSSSCCPSMLYLASILGNLKVVDILISYKVDVRAKNNIEYTSIFAACLHGHFEVVKILLEEDPALLDWRQPETPLYAATSSGFWKCAELLLGKGADPNRPRKDTPETSGDDLPDYDWTLISISCSNGYVNTVQNLLEYKADPNTAGPSGINTCLWLAAMNCGSLEIMKLLLEHGADPNHELLEPPILSEIIENVKISDMTKIKMFDLLIENDRPVDLERRDKYGLTPLMVVGQAGNQSAVQWLLNRTASINTLDFENQSVLFHTILNKKWNVVHYLLAHHEQPQLDLLSSSDLTLLELTMDHIDELKALLDAGADPSFQDSCKRTLLNNAVVAQKEEVVGLLLEPARHIDVHRRDNAGWSPIMDATGYIPNAQIARLLLDAGARLSDTTEGGYSPLHLAASLGRSDVLQVLLKQVLLNFHQPDDLVRCGIKGRTALLAVSDFTRTEDLECIRLLVRAGADINARDSNGETVLIRSARFGANATAVHDWLLAQPKTDIHLKAREGTALHIACGYGDIVLVKKLLQYGADANANCISFRSTPLIAACIPYNLDGYRNLSPKMENAERIVRALIANGADAAFTCGISIFNAVCAAPLCPEIGIINFQLDRAISIQTPDPLGRLPIHFAAANSIRNFETVALAHGENIMICDKFNKTALH
ncbi:f5e6bcd6-6814-4982-8ce6-b018c14a97e8 [Sclerotinia trifoliorum]|uniref:F5e6bcd6-6814-4982-8ce6-b018c14a97e8 n=1 Tax=Sclerotinia trifoliorum TaxID=28548 RepID=A0A8H2ZQQ6_9HELO|nr:f5e6bcd6-6814-4982-8ce6-b018c14a97e8 [Sclerotinia trifoliorum]